MTTVPDPGATELPFGPATTGDVDSLVAIDSDSPRPWSRAAFEEELRRGGTVFVLRRGGAAVAFAAVRKLGPELDIVNLAVHPEQRRLGFGRILLRALLDQAASSGVETVFLEVRESNLGAAHLYGHFGFQVTQRRPDFYRDPVEAAILLRLQIGAQNTVERPKKRVLGSRR